jgi:hypothetical protein
MPILFSHRIPIFLICFLIGLLYGCNGNSGNTTGSGLATTGVATQSGAGNSGVSTHDPQDSLDEDDLSDLDNDFDGANSSGSAPISPHELTLSWRPNTGLIDGYMIFHGPDPDSATALLSITLETTVHLDPVLDLGLKSGDLACFRIKAYNATGTSDFSDAVCFTYNA